MCEREGEKEENRRPARFFMSNHLCMYQISLHTHHVNMDY